MKELLATEKAAGNLRRYLSSYGGAQFDRLTDRLVRDEFTPADFKAVRELRVSVLHPARQWLLGEGRDQVQQLLQDIPADLDIWEVPADRFDSELGPDSPAWRLWQIISDRKRPPYGGQQATAQGDLAAGVVPGLGEYGASW